MLLFNSLSAMIFTDFELLDLLEGRVLHEGAWAVTLLGTLLGVQNYKKVKFPGRDISSLAVKGLKNDWIIIQLEYSNLKRLKKKNLN